MSALALVLWILWFVAVLLKALHVISIDWGLLAVIGVSVVGVLSLLGRVWP